MSRKRAAITIIALIVLVVLVPVGLALGFAAVQGVGATRSLQQNIAALQEAIAAPEPARTEAIRELDQPWRFLAEFIKGVQAPPPLTEPPAGDPRAPAPGDGAARGPPPPAEPALEPVPTPGAPAATGNGTPPGAARDLDPSERMMEWVTSFKSETGVAVGQVFQYLLGTGGNVLHVAGRVLGMLAYAVFALFLILFFFFFFSTRYERVLSRFTELIPKWKRERTLAMLRQMDAVIAGFVRGRLMIGLILSVFYVVGYWLVGVPMPLLVGVVVGLLSIAPYVPMIGLPLAVGLMVLYPSDVEWQTRWWWVLLAPTVVYAVGQFFDDYIFTPVVMGKTTDMDVPTILFAVIAGGLLFGIYGVLVAIPAAACMKILLRESFWPRFRAWAEGRAKDFLPISRYDPTETAATPSTTAVATVVAEGETVRIEAAPPAPPGPAEKGARD